MGGGGLNPQTPLSLRHCKVFNKYYDKTFSSYTVDNSFKFAILFGDGFTTEYFAKTFSET